MVFPARLNAEKGVELMLGAEVEKTLRKYWDDGSVPVDPMRIAASMGIVLIGDPSFKASGHYIPANPETQEPPKIFYNSSESYVRQRFTVAHEIAHHVLNHGERNRDTPADFTMGTRDPKEKAANMFAARLLMPTDSIHAAIAVKRLGTVEELARAFWVSQAAMRYRLKEIGYNVC